VADNATGFSCLTEPVSIIDSGYSAYYMINLYYASGETDYLSLFFAGGMVVKALNTARDM
jgi:hypothetical protein